MVQRVRAHGHFTWHLEVKEMAGPLCGRVSLLSSITVLKWMWRKPPSISDRLIRGLRSTTKVFIKPSCLHKMKDGHLLSQHAVSGQWKRGREGCGDKEREGALERKKRQIQRGKDNMWLSGNVRRTFQGYTPRPCHFWESILSPCMTAITHQPMNDANVTVSVQYVSGHCSQFKSPDTTSNACSLNNPYT